MTVQLRIIGDVHGKMKDYFAKARIAQYSVQVGDLSTRPGDYFLLEDNLNPANHRVVAGNHDCYTENNGKFVYQPDHFLGNFGTHYIEGWGEFFYLRGGHSIDWETRTIGLDWWSAEQLSYDDCCLALDFYNANKPEFVITHECPTSVIDSISTLKMFDGKIILPSMTSRLLQTMLELHQPKTWVFGHHHKQKVIRAGKTTFYCLEELGTLDFFKV